MTAMYDIVALAREFAAAHEDLETTATEIKALQRKAVSSRLRGLRARIAAAAAAHDALRDAITARPELFAKPRTLPSTA